MMSAVSRIGPFQGPCPTSGLNIISPGLTGSQSLGKKLTQPENMLAFPGCCLREDWSLCFSCYHRGMCGMTPES